MYRDYVVDVSNVLCKENGQCHKNPVRAQLPLAPRLGR